MAPPDQALVELVEQKRLELEKSAFVATLYRSLQRFKPNVKTIRFLAVGNFGIDNMNVEYQTALVLLMQARFNVQHITAWDPNFKKRDLRILNQFGICVTKEDPKPDNTTLWFAPHAPYYLEPQLLNRVGTNIYIGNDLNLHAENTMRDVKATELYRAVAQSSSWKVKHKEPFWPAFKNTAIYRLISEESTEPVNTKLHPIETA